MKRKAFLAVSLALVVITAFAAGALAGSRWGDFDGYPMTRVLVNGTALSGDVPAISFHGRTVAPIRSVAEALGARVDWDAESQTALISAPALAAISWPPQVNAWLDKLAADFPGWNWAVGQGLLQPVNAEAEGNGYKWHVYAVLADATQTNLIFSVAGERPTVPRVIGPMASTFNGKPLLSRAASGRVIDGVCVGIMTFDPIPATVGTVTVTAEGIGAVDGNWAVTVPVSRSKCDEATREYNLGRDFALGDGTVTVKRLVVTPVHTMIEASWAGTTPVGGEARAPRLQASPSMATLGSDWGIMLLGADGARLAKGIGGARIQTHQADDGQTTAEYTMFFDRCQPLPDTVTLHVGGAVYVTEETRVPLEAGAKATAPDGCPISVTSVEGTGAAGTAVVDYKPNPSYPPFYSDWLVIDNTGERTQVELRPTAAGMGYAWELPAGRKADALVLPGYWTAAEAGDLTIDTK